MDGKKKRSVTICCQSGRILLLIPTAIVVLVVMFTTLIMEWLTGNANYMMAGQLFLFAIGLLLLMLPGFLVSAWLGKPLCTADDEGICYKGRCIRWSDIISMEYVYGYTRYHGDHSCIKISAGSEEISLPRGPIWLPLYARRYTSEFSVAIPHLKRHLKRGIVIGAVLSVIIIGIYIL